MESNPKPKFRTVNTTLGKQPKIGPFPADQFVPWMVICGVSYYLFKVTLNLSWVWTGALAAWGMSTWWVLTGSRSWRFLSKFVPVPNWVRAYTTYRRLLNSQSRAGEQKNGKNQGRKKARR
ncbi:MAG: hypothetical protein F6K21_02565 [Symploca sp. SIO2D2]|nr:hypothetical protein [Symploca sp. SIO2D2]